MAASRNTDRISIQVSLGGYSFIVDGPDGVRRSGWKGAETLFTTPEFQRRYAQVEISLLTPKCALVPTAFFRPEEARRLLSDGVALRDSDPVSYVSVPEYGAVMLYSNAVDESLSRVIAQTVLATDGSQAEVLPELYYVLRELSRCEEYNKIVASWRDGWLYLAVAQGKSLQLCNVFDAVDFTTAEYFIFLTLKKLQLNPELSVIRLRTPLPLEDEMSLYRYFKGVELL